MTEYHPISAKDLLRLHQFGPKVLPGMSLGCALYAGWIWKGDIMIADIEELVEMDASEIHARRLNAREVLTPMKGENFYIPSRRWNSQNPWRRSTSETVHLNQGSPRPRRRTRKSSRIIRWITFSNPSSRWLSMDDAEAKNDFCSVTGDFIYRHHVEPRVKLYMSRRIISYSADVHRRYQNHSFVTGCFVGKNIDDYWNVDGGKELSDAWTCFKMFMLLIERPPDGFSWSGERLMREQTTSRPDNVWPDMWKHMSDAPKSKAKQKWAIEKPRLGNVRQLRGIFFTEPNDEEFKRTMKAARSKLEIPMPTAMPCKTPVNCRGETCRNIGKHKTKCACIVGAKISKVRRQSRTPRWHCERWFRIVCIVHWTRFIGVTNDGCKSHGHYFKTTRIRRNKQQTEYRPLPMPEWKMHHLYWRSQNQNVQTLRPPRHKWPKSWSSVEDPVVPLERNLHGHPSAGLLWERQFEKVLLK